MSVDYKRADFLKDLFQEEDIPRQMTTEQFDDLVIKHKELMKQRELDAQRASKLKQQEYEANLKHKETIQYSDAIAQEICERVSSGELLINICDDYHMPTLKRVNQWLKLNNDFRVLHEQAIQDRLNIFEEQIIKIADDTTKDYKEVTIKRVTKRVIDPEVIARAKLRIEVRFRHLRAGRPNKWSDQSTINVNNSNEDDPATLSNEEIERRIAEIENKEKIVKFTK